MAVAQDKRASELTAPVSIADTDVFAGYRPGTGGEPNLDIRATAGLIRAPIIAGLAAGDAVVDARGVVTSADAASGRRDRTQVQINEQQIRLEDYAIFDGQDLTSGAITAGSDVLTVSSTIGCAVGQTVIVPGAKTGASNAGNALSATIVSVDSSTQLTLSAQANATVSGKTCSCGTDNATSLIALRNSLLAIQAASAVQIMFRLLLPRGKRAHYSNNRWLHQIKRLMLVGDGTQLQCIRIDSTGQKIDWAPLKFASMYTRDGDGDGRASTLANYKLATTYSGNDTITFQTTAHAANFAAGNRIFVYGFYKTADAAFPPCPLYFHYSKVKSVDTNAGTVTLTERLPFAIDANWPDNTTAGPNHGIPRALNMDAPGNIMPERVHMENIEFLVHPSDTTAGANAINTHGNSWRIINCRAPIWYPTEVDQFRATDLQSQFIEGDKNIGRLVVDGTCTFPMKRATGCNELIYAPGYQGLTEQQVTIDQQPYRASPTSAARKVKSTHAVHRCVPTETASVFAIESAFFNEAVTFADNTFQPAGACVHGLGLPTTTNFTAGSNTANGEISISSFTVARALGRGCRLSKREGDKFGTVTEVYFHAGTSEWRARGDWSSNPASSEVWYFVPVGTWDIRGNVSDPLRNLVLTGTVTAGTANTVTLPSTGYVAVSDYYAGCTLRIIAGTGAGDPAVAITASNASTRVLTADRNFTTQPDATSVFELEFPSRALKDPLFRGGTLVPAHGEITRLVRFVLDDVLKSLTINVMRAGPASSTMTLKIQDWASTTLDTIATIDLSKTGARRLGGLGAHIQQTATAGSTTSFTFASPASATANFYKYCRFLVLSGTGAGQRGIITGWSTGRVATVTDYDGSALGTALDNTSVVQISGQLGGLQGTDMPGVGRVGAFCPLILPQFTGVSGYTDPAQLPAVELIINR